MDAELLVAGESLEMLTGLPRTLGAGELGEVTVLITESKLRVDRSALGLHSYGFPAASVKERLWRSCCIWLKLVLGDFGNAMM